MLALLPSRPSAASRDVPRLPHILPSEVIERNAPSLPAECQRFGPRAWPNIGQIVSGFRSLNQVHPFPKRSEAIVRRLYDTARSSSVPAHRVAAI